MDAGTYGNTTFQSHTAHTLAPVESEMTVVAGLQRESTQPSQPVESQSELIWWVDHFTKNGYVRYQGEHFCPPYHAQKLKT
jgi:hypothetical protein